MTDRELKKRVAIWKQCDCHAVRAAAKLGLHPSTVRRSLAAALQKGLLTGQAKRGVGGTLADRVLRAKPSTWLDSMSTEQQEDMRTLKRNHLAGKHAIAIKQIYDMALETYPALRGTVSYRTFRNWILDEQAEAPRA